MAVTMNILQSIRSFIRTADAGSLAAAARTLGISAAAVGQNIARLEAHLGVRLFNRTTRQLALTERGALYLAQVRYIERDLQRAQAAVTDLDATPEGRLRIACSTSFGRHKLAPLLPSLKARYPRLAIELLLADRAVDHAREDVDVSIRIEPQLEEGLVARPIAQVPFVFCAAPSYLARTGVPRTPEALREHRCLLFRHPKDGRHLRWGSCATGCASMPTSVRRWSATISMRWPRWRLPAAASPAWRRSSPRPIWRAVNCRPCSKAMKPAMRRRCPSRCGCFCVSATAAT